MDEFTQNWNLIRDALNDIHNQNAGRLSFEQLYRASYKAVLMKRGEELYMQVETFERQHFAEKVIPAIWQLVTRQLVSVTLHSVTNTTTHSRREMGERLLRGIKEAWERHNTAMNMVADVLMYLDRGYAQDCNRPFIYATTIGLFRDHILRAPLPQSIYSEADRYASSLAEGAAAAEGSTAAATANGSNSQPTIYTILSAVILDQIDMDRNGEIIDRHLLRNCIAMLESLYRTDDEEEEDKLYLTMFEPQYLAATQAFYRAECERLLRGGDALVWLNRTNNRLREERDRCGHSISQETIAKVQRVVEKELVVAHLKDFLDMETSGLQRMIDQDSDDDLRTLYELVYKIPESQSVLLGAIQQRVIELGRDIEKTLRETDFSVAAVATAPSAKPRSAKAAGKAPATAGDDEAADDATPTAPAAKAAGTLTVAAQQTAAAIKWVSDILDLKEKFLRMLRDCFRSDKGIEKSINVSFTELFKMCTRSAEYVSLFIDDNFKRGLRGKSDAEIDLAMDHATVLVHHVTEKDMLQRYYQKHLARRLLHNKSENPEAEKSMISRMQGNLGRAFTTKFEGMFKDMATSEELTREYGSYVRESLGDDGKGKDSTARIDLSVNVLTSNNWPPEVMGRAAQSDDASGHSAGSSLTPSAQCTYPADIVRLQQSFLKFYLRNRSGRVLSWVASTGSADLRCVFPKIEGHDKGPLSRERRYELNVSTHGMVLLLLFNGLGDSERLTFEEIQGRTSIPGPDLIKALASLSIHPKCRMLTKEPMSKTIRPGDRFGFNAQFVSKALKIKMPVVNAVSKVEGDDERRVTEEKNNQTRSHTIDAAVVRIMKQRRELTHTGLVTEVVSQLASRFKPEVAMVKRRIEDLISREYLERLEDREPPAYRYVA